MAAVSYNMRTGLALFLLTIFAALLSDAYASGRKAPVLRRSDNGTFVYSGERKDVPDYDKPPRKIFDYDDVSRRLASRAMLTKGGGPGVVEGTIRVVVLRIAFRNNSMPGLTSISTDGDFDLTPGGTSLIDPTPHNSVYFSGHMQGLHNYIDLQSCGKLQVEWDILPQEENGSYKLSDIADYGPGSGGGWTTPQLAHFLYDAVVTADQELADQGYPVRLSDYDAVILVHAGADLQSDYYSDSPNDIPSFFARLGDVDQIPIEGGSTIISEISVVPETATQDGIHGSQASVLAHEFGHVLGLPDLYDVYYGMPIVGVWDQMDSGSQVGVYLIDGDEEIYVLGILPAGFGAWSKYMLGWLDVDTVQTFDNEIALSALEKCPSRAVRVDITGDEYYLIENRAAETDDIYTQPVWDPVSGVVIGWGNCLNCDEGEVDEYEWELVNTYDILLPTESDYPSSDGGPGLLVWHIDESFIADRWYENEVNSRWPFGVWLVEAGGETDLGNPYSGYRMGWFDDAFYAGNSEVMSDSTFPSAWSNWGVPSGVRLENVSGRDTLMTFGAGVRDIDYSEPFVPATTIPDGGALHLAGQNRSVLVDAFGGVYVTGHDEMVAHVAVPAMTPMLLAPGFDSSDGADAVIIVGADGLFHALSTYDWEAINDSWPASFGAGPVTHPALFTADEDVMIAAVFDDGSMRLTGRSAVDEVDPYYLPDGMSFSGNLVIEDDGTGNSTHMVILVTGQVTGETRLSRFSPVDGNIVQLLGWDPVIPLSQTDMSGRIVLLGGDLDPAADGYEFYVVAMSTGRVICCGQDGIISDRSLGKAVISVPALQDMNGDSYIDIVMTDGINIHVRGTTGSSITGWPRNINDMFVLPMEIRITAALTTASSSEGAWVAVGTDAGIFFILDHMGELVPGYPKRIASSLNQPVELTVSGEEGQYIYLDMIYNHGINEFYDFRPPGGSVKWRRGDFGPPDPDISWPMLYGDTGRTGFASGSSGFDTAIPAWTELEEGITIYPNPSRTGKVSVHFSAPESGKASIRIMTLTGELIFEETKQLSGGEDEFEISMLDKASGVYICRLEIEAGSRSVSINRKFAVIR
ncbi:MAG: immune inhibitor A [Bacteroidales bacterium]|nr:immune inhibitor A [Candidatus Latescibacterota bacterium]